MADAGLLRQENTALLRRAMQDGVFSKNELARQTGLSFPTVGRIIDDMVDTAGTITKAANLMKEKGAKSVRALASHAIMSDPASERVDECALTEIIFSNSIPYKGNSKKVTTLSIAPLFADTIRRVHKYESISSQYLIK